MTQLAKPTFTQPVQVPVPLLEGERTVQSANVGTLLQLKAQLMPALQLLLERAPAIFDQVRIERIKAERALAPQDLADLCVMLDEADVVVDVVALLAGLGRDQVLALQPDEFAYLFAVVVQVNADFFVRAATTFKAAAALLQEAGSGPSASGTSSSPAPSTA